MGLERSILEFNVQLFKNSKMVPLATVVEGGRLSKDAREALKKFVRERATGEIEGQLRVFRETVLRPARRKLELGLHALLEELEPSAYVRFAEMDITSIRDDADFWDKMIERGGTGLNRCGR